jgi:hypothetical protein
MAMLSKLRSMQMQNTTPSIPVPKIEKLHRIEAKMQHFFAPNSYQCYANANDANANAANQ